MYISFKYNKGEIKLKNKKKKRGIYYEKSSY